MPDYKTGCLICGEELIYGKTEKMECYYCHKIYESNVRCKNGHFICEVSQFGWQRVDREFLYHYQAREPNGNRIDFDEKSNDKDAWSRTSFSRPSGSARIILQY